MSNKSEGTKLEKKVADLLYKDGWWVHLLTQSNAGQPADIIACKDITTMLIDCKDCKGKSFDLDRVEENQINAMRLFTERTMGLALFVIQLNDKLYFVDYKAIMEAIERGNKALKEQWLENNKENWNL